MFAIDFKHRNIIYAEDQEEYYPLPARVYINCQGQVAAITCWELNREEIAEIAEIAETGKLFLEFVTFGKRLQPIVPRSENPFVDKDVDIKFTIT